MAKRAMKGNGAAQPDLAALAAVIGRAIARQNATQVESPTASTGTNPRVRRGVRVIIGMSQADYNAGAGLKKPSLSASIAYLIQRRSEKHAWHAHPQLNPKWASRRGSDDMMRGSALHTLVLGAGPEIVRVGAPDWRQDWTKEKRERVARSGGLAFLADDIPRLVDCAEAVKVELRANPAVADFFGPGSAEVVIIARLGPNKTLCRTRIDWLLDDPTAWVYDLKFTKRSAAPEEWEHNVWKEYAIQAEMICRCVKAARGVRPPGVRFVAAEMDDPWGVSILTAAPDTIGYAKQQLDEATARWDKALATDTWPKYPRQVGAVELPGWMLAKFEEGQYLRGQQVTSRLTQSQQEHEAALAELLGEPPP